jgi:PIN domain nuclease of toxin-antitoxin system
MTVVLDASALIATLNEEIGGEVVAAVLGEAIVCSVNLAEVAAALVSKGNSTVQVRGILATLGIATIVADDELALDAAFLRPATARAGLSLGDRFCLATARRLGAPALTADRVWMAIADDAEVEIQLIR